MKTTVNKNVKYATLKVGDKVQVRSDLRKDGNYENYNGVNDVVVSGMLEMAGKTATISRIGSNGEFKLAEDKSLCWWTSEMFAGQVVEPKHEVDDSGMMLQATIIITRVIHANPHTIVFYKDFDGKKRKVKTQCNDGDTYDKQKGVEIATLKALKREAERNLKKF